MILILTGPAGVGKSTVGRHLALRLDWVFVEGDAFHTSAAKRAMATGTPLTDDDRLPWLKALRKRIDRLLEDDADAVIACSALKPSYRAMLKRDDDNVLFVRLVASEQELRRRLRERRGHFAGVELLPSQLAALDDDEGLTIIDAQRSVDDVVDTIIRRIEPEARPR